MRDADPIFADQSLLPTEADVANNREYRERYEGGEPEVDFRESTNGPELSPAEIAKLISDDAHELVIYYEVEGRKGYLRRYCHPEWPGGDSGITIGYGYDLGYYQRAEVASDWKNLISAEDFEKLQPVVGLKRAAAHSLLSPTLKQMVIPIEAAEAVYRNVTVPKYGRQTAHCFQGSTALHPHCFGALYSLVYNRGAGMKGDKRLEMREIRDAIAANKAELVPALLKKMKQRWPATQKGLWLRRDAEAELFARGLREMDKARRSIPVATVAPLGPLAANTFAPPTTNLESIDGGARISPTEDGDLSYAHEDPYSGGAEPPDGPRESVAEHHDWEKVQWVADDNLSTEYRHTLVADRVKQQNVVFELTAADLDLLIRANGFAPLPTNERRVIFGLRGCLLNAEGADPGDASAQVDQPSLRLQVARPNHADFRCVMGVYDLDTRHLSGFVASTVPNRYIVYRYYRIHDQGNLLACGSYRYRVGPHHNGKYPGCLRQDDAAAVLRSRNDPVYDVRDDWDVRTDPPPMDNIHPAFSDKQKSAPFSSFGCQVIRGAYPDGAYSKEFAKFRTALGLKAPGTDNDRIFCYLLLTGLEAAIAAQLRRDGTDGDPVVVRSSLVRIRQGSRGDTVRALQTALHRQATGVFSAYDKLALVALQRKSISPDAGDGVFSPQLDQVLGLAVFGHDVPAAPTAPLVVASLPNGGSQLEGLGLGAGSALDPVLYDIGRRAILARGSADLLTADVLPHYEAIDDVNWATKIACGNAVVSRIERMAHELVCGEAAPVDGDRQAIKAILIDAAAKDIPALTFALSRILTGWLMVPTPVAKPISEIIVARIVANASGQIDGRRFKSIEAFLASWGAGLYKAALATEPLAPSPLPQSITANAGSSPTRELL